MTSPRHYSTEMEKKRRNGQLYTFWEPKIRAAGQRVLLTITGPVLKFMPGSRPAGDDVLENRGGNFPLSVGGRG